MMILVRIFGSAVLNCGPGRRMEGDARLPDVLLGDEGADGGRYRGRKVGDLAVGVRRLLKVFGKGDHKAQGQSTQRK